MDLIICFIDDSDFEHDLMRNEIAPSAPALHFIQTYTFEEARDRLRNRIPGLFLLDLWGQDPEVVSPYITPKDEVEKIADGFNTLDDVYKGIEDFQGDKTNEFLKRMFTIVAGWRNMFELVCGRIGQNRKYGLANLEQVRRYYPGVTGVFYTRKSLISDAVAMIKAGADGLFIKPTGMQDFETRKLTREKAPGLIEEWAGIIGSRIEHLKDHLEFYGAETSQSKMYIHKLISGWKEFINNSK